MENDEVLKSFFEAVQNSIKNKTFSKLTLAKTIGNTQLLNIYARLIFENETLVFELKYKYQQEEQIEIYAIEKAFEVLQNFIENPFLSLLLFTTQNDITLKINKKRDFKIVVQPPTFKHAAEVFVN